VGIHAEPETEKEKNSSIKVSHYTVFQILVFLALVLASTAVLFLVQKALLLRMEAFRNTLIGQAEDYLNRKIRYSSMGPSLFGTLDIRNVSISGSGEEPVLSIGRFRFSYSFIDLIQGKAEAFRSVLIDHPVLRFDAGRDRDLADLLPSFQENSRDSLGLVAGRLPERVFFRVRNAQAYITNGADNFSVRKTNFDASISGGRIVLKGKWDADIRLRPFDVFSGKPFRAGMTGRIEAFCTTDLKTGEALVTIPVLAGDLFRLESLAFNVSLHDNKFRLKKKADSLPYDYSLAYDLNTEDSSVSFSSDDFSLSELVSLRGAWDAYNPFLAVRVSGNTGLTKTKGEGIQYVVDMTGNIPSGLPLGGASFAAEADGDENFVSVKRCFFDIPQGRFQYIGGVGLKPLSPNGTITISDFSIFGGETLSTEFTVSTQDSVINLFAETLAVDSVRISALDMSFDVRDTAVFFNASALRFRDIESYKDVRLSSISLDGFFDTTERRIDANFILDSFSAEDLSLLAKPFIREQELPGLLSYLINDISITTEVFVTTDFNHILYNIPRLVVAYEGIRNITALLSVSGTDQRVELTEGRLVWDKGGMELTGGADFSNINDIAFSLMTFYQNQSYFAEGVVLDLRAISIQGSYGLRLYLSTTSSGGYSGYLEAENTPLPFRGQIARLSLFSSIRFDSRDLWSFNINRLDIDGLSAPGSPEAVLRIAGGADQDGAFLPLIYYNDRLGALNGNMNVSWRRDFSAFKGSLLIQEEMGDETYSAEALFEEGHFEMDLSGTHMELDRFLTRDYSAILDGSIRLTWDSIQAFRADITLASLTARIQDRELRASAAALIDGDSFDLSGMRVTYSGIEAEVPYVRINRPGASVTAEAYVKGNITGRQMETSFSLNSQFNHFDTWLEAPGALAEFNGTMRISDVRFDTVRSNEPFDFVFSRSGSVISLSGGPNEMIRLQLSDSGDFYAGLSNPSPIRGSLAGTIRSNAIDARSPDLYVDLPALWKLVPSVPDFALTGGYVTASVDIRGPLGDPDFFGSARGNSVKIQVTQFVPRDIQPVPFDVAIEGNEMTFGPVEAVVGAGMGTVNGWFRFDRWIPNIFSMDIQVPPETPIPVAFDIGGFIANGQAAGKLNLSMRDLVLFVTGNVTAQDTEITLNTDELTSAQNADLFLSPFPVTVDMDVTTGPKVEFAWPTTKFPILRAFADMGTNVRVAVDTLSRRFSITSDVRIRSGEIFYFERNFYIRNGVLSFNENEVNFAPRITARAEVRDQTDKGPVTISLIVENAPLFNFTARFESNPPLSQMEIFSLLGQSLTGAPEDESGGTIRRAFLNSTADVLAQWQVVRRLERNIRDFLNLDMFTVRTQILQNAIFRATGLHDPVDRIDSVGNYFDNSTVFLGKYFGPNVFGQAMVALRYDKNRVTFGGITPGGVALGGGILLEANFGVEIRNPLFNIRWDFVPLHPENLFIQDNSISLLWSWSF
jgi:hypothetical protein